MSQQAIALLTLPLVANLAVTQYRGVGFNGGQANTAGQKVLGIARRSAANGQDLEVTAKGTAVAEAGGAFAPGSALAMDASGRVVAASPLQVAAGATAVTSTLASGSILTGGDLPQYIVGFALQAAAAAGDLVEILMN